MAGQKLMMALVATAMCSSACAPSAETGSPTLPPGPEVRDVRSTTPFVHDDGLLRVVVSIPDANRSSTNDRVNDDSSAVIGDLEGAGASDPLLRDELLGLPAGSTLVLRDGVLGYVSDDVFVPLDNEANNKPSAATFDDDADVVAVLRATSGVESVRPITESSYAVTASSIEGIAALGVEINDDVPLAFTADPYEPYQWALENNGDNFAGVVLPQPPSLSPDADVDGLEARDGATGRGIVVAVIDAGVDFGHPDLSHARWENGTERCDGSSAGVDDDGNGYVDDCFGWDFGDEDATPFDGNNDEHGTHVAGIIAAKADNNIAVAGIAPDVKIMDLKVSDRAAAISSSSIARAIRYAADNGADVVNLSLGTEPGASLASVAVIAEAVDYAGSAGVLLVAAAGNSSISLDTSPVYPASFDAAHLLTVGASTPADRRASFSNTGSDIDLFAPGDLILSTIPGGDVAFMSGTSQAAPIAAATAALMLEQDGGKSPAAVIDRMVNAGDRIENLDGMAANPVRLNTARTLGIEADVPGAGDAITIRGLETDVDGLVTAQVTIGELGGQFNQPFHWEASLLTLVEGQLFAVAEHPVTVQDIAGDELRSSQTDQRGAVLLADKEASSAGWSTTLPDGSYALLIEAIPRTDPTVRLGDGFVARFDVGQPATDGSESASGSGTDGSSDTGSGDSTGGSTGAGATIDDVPNAEDFVPGSGDTGSGSEGVDSGGVNGGDGSGGASSGEVNSGDDDSANDETEAPDRAGSDGPGTTGTDEPDSGGTDPNGTESNDDGGLSPTGDSPTGEDSDGEDENGSGDVSLGATEVADGLWSITSVTPRTGPVDSANLVVIDGTFPEDVIVWFGGGPGETIFQSNSSIMVETPIHAAAQTVDVSLRTRDGDVLVLTDGYAFVSAGENGSGDGTIDAGNDGSGTDVGADAGGSTDSASESGSSGNNGSDDANGTDDDGGVVDEPTFDDDPSDVVEVDGTPPANDSSDADDGEGSKSRNRQARANMTGDARVLPNGLTGVPMSGLDTVGGVPACDEALCRTRRV